MTFKLRVTFAGMCLLVEDGKYMHALLPPVGVGHDGTTHTGDQHVAAHELMLVYDEGHHHTPPKPTRVAQQRSLVNKQLRLLGLSETPLKPPPVNGIADVEAIMSRRVPRDLLDLNHTGHRVLARVTLDAGRSRVHRGAEGGVWRVKHSNEPPHPRRLAIKVTWEMQAEGEALDLTLDALNGGNSPETFTLRPFANTGIRLWIYNNPRIPSKLPPRNRGRIPNDGEPAHHFQAFYTMLDPGREYPLPVFFHADNRARRNPAEPMSEILDTRASEKIVAPLGDEIGCMAARSTAVAQENASSEPY